MTQLIKVRWKHTFFSFCNEEKWSRNFLSHHQAHENRLCIIYSHTHVCIQSIREFSDFNQVLYANAILLYARREKKCEEKCCGISREWRSSPRQLFLLLSSPLYFYFAAMWQEVETRKYFCVQIFHYRNCSSLRWLIEYSYMMHLQLSDCINLQAALSLLNSFTLAAIFFSSL